MGNLKEMDPMSDDKPTPLYTRIYNVVRQVPEGKVVAYGQIANMLGGCSARQVGYAMSALKESKEMLDVPWQRVINSQGRCSTFGGGIGTSMQSQLLVQEGIRFDDTGRVTDLAQWWIERPF
jgi:methylated-DNA-protein-cysteine methyltransferase related protein